MMIKIMAVDELPDFVIIFTIQNKLKLAAEEKL